MTEKKEAEHTGGLKIRLTVAEKDVGKRLDAFLAEASSNAASAGLSEAYHSADRQQRGCVKRDLSLWTEKQP